MNYIEEIQKYLININIKYIDNNLEYINDEIKWVVLINNNEYTFIQNKNKIKMITLNETIYYYDKIINYLENNFLNEINNIFNNLNLSDDNDFFDNIKKFLNIINVDYSDYDDDRKYYDGFDDVWVVNLLGTTYKFVQNIENKKVVGIMMVSNNTILYKYDEIIDYLNKNLPY